MKSYLHYFLYAWIFLGLCFKVNQSIFAAGSANNRVILDANCSNAGVVVSISDLSFDDVVSKDQSQTVRGRWSQSTFSSNYYGEVPFHGIVVEDANANCGIVTDGSVVTPAWYITLSTDLLSGADASQHYILEPNGSHDDQFDYETLKSYIHMEVDTTDSITALTGNGTHQLIDEQVVFAHDSFTIDFLEKNLMERTSIQGDQRKGLFQIDPQIRLTLPGNFPDVIYEGALYINLYAQATEVVIDNGSGENSTGSNSIDDGLWDLPIFHEFNIWDRIRNQVLTLGPFIQSYFIGYLERLADRYEAGIYNRRYIRDRLRQIWQIVRRY